MSVQPAQPMPLPLDHRRAILQGAVAHQLMRDGRVAHQTDTQAVLVYGSEPAHAVHALLALLTCGLWLFVWIPLALFGGEARRAVFVDEWGQVHMQGWGVES